MFTYEATVEKVVDGDTLDLRVDLGFSVSVFERFRIYGLNTPETNTKNVKEKTAGLAAKAFVQKILDAQKETVRVQTHKDDKEKYGRYLAEVFVRLDEMGKSWPGQPYRSLAEILIEKGHGKEYFGGKRE